MKQSKPTGIILAVVMVTIIVLLYFVGPSNGTEIMYKRDEKRSHIVSPLPYEYLPEASLPKSFDWGRVDAGKRSLLTHMLNQHIPQVCLYIGLRLFFNP